MRTLERPLKDYFISVGLRRDHKKTILKDCFIANGLHKDLKKTINDLQVSGAVCPFYFFVPEDRFGIC